MAEFSSPRAPADPAVLRDLPATSGERRASWKAARKRARRGLLEYWDEQERGHDALQTILAQNKIRVPELVPVRHQRMAVSPWNYYRGAAGVMAGDLASQPDSGLEVQLCGDAHVLNFGLWATPERNLFFDLRDFDETLSGPFEWDVKRFAASLVVAARENRIRTSRGAFAKLTTMAHGRPRISTDPPVRVTISDDEQADLVAHLLSEYRLTLQEDRRSLFDRFTEVDTVRQVVGVGSVGMRVYLVLLEGRSGADPLFLQVKQAGPSVYEVHTRPSPHDHAGARVISGKRLVQTATDIFVGWGSFHGRDYYVRQFRDMKIIPTTELIAPRLSEFATACGEALARAHARTGDPVAINGYIGKGAKFADAIGRFALPVRRSERTGSRPACQRDHRRRRRQPARLNRPIRPARVPGCRY
jgi:uncharacterized protein (DUF2252 family)